MDFLRPFIPVAILSVLALLFQAFFSNAIHIGNAMPNFILMMGIIITILHPTLSSVVICFVLGLLYNLCGSGPVGAMAFVMTLLSFGVMFLFSRMGGTSFLLAIIVLVICAFVGEILYGVLSATFVSGISVSEALTLRALPCGLYDAAISLVLYPLPAFLARVSANQQQPQGPGSWSL